MLTQTLRRPLIKKPVVKHVIDWIYNMFNTHKILICSSLPKLINISGRQVLWRQSCRLHCYRSKIRRSLCLLFFKGQVTVDKHTRCLFYDSVYLGNTVRIANSLVQLSTKKIFLRTAEASELSVASVLFAYVEIRRWLTLKATGPADPKEEWFWRRKTL